MMKRLVWSVLLVLWSFTASAVADILVFTDGSRMEVRSYQVKGALVLVTTMQGQLRSVPRSYVDLEATQRLNRAGTKTRAAPSSASPSSSAPRPKAPAQEKPPTGQAPAKPAEAEKAPEKPAAPAKTVSSPPSPPPAAAPKPSPPSAPASEQPPAAPKPPPAAPPAKQPPAAPPQPVPPAPAVTPPTRQPAVPPPVWTDEELKVSVVIPSASWHVETQGASFDVAVRLENRTSGARATLALIRQRMRNYKDFQKVVADVEQSLTSSPNYRGLSSGPLPLKPYTAHEFRYVKGIDGASSFNRMVIYYSRDLAYVLSLSCPEELREQNEADFDALVGGLVIKKVRKDITPKGAPKT